MASEGNASGGSSSSSSTLIALLASVVLLVLVLHAREAKATKRIININDLSQTILVLIVHNNGDAGSTKLSTILTKPAVVSTIESVYSTAFEPSRVNVAVYDFGDSVYHHLPTNLQPTVRVERNCGVLYRHTSSSDARNHLLKTCYRSEKYILTIKAGSTLTESWDAKAIELLHIATKANSQKNKVMLTSSLSIDGPNFLSVKDIAGEKLIIKTKEVKNEADAPFQSTLLSPDFLFAHSSIFMDIGFVEGGGIGSSDNMDVTVNSIRFWTSGCDFYQLPIMLARGPPTSKRRAVWKSKRKEKVVSYIGEIRSHSEFEHFVGVNFGTLTVSSRAEAGLTPSPSADEARAKCGSIENARAESRKK